MKEESNVTGGRTNILTRSKGLVAKATKTKCTKITLGN